MKEELHTKFLAGKIAEKCSFRRHALIRGWYYNWS